MAKNSTSVWKLTTAFLAGVSSVFIFKEVSRHKEVREALKKTEEAFQKGVSSANKGMKAAFDHKQLRKFKKALKEKLNALKKLIAEQEDGQREGVKTGKSRVKKRQATGGSNTES